MTSSIDRLNQCRAPLAGPISVFAPLAFAALLSGCDKPPPAEAPAAPAAAETAAESAPPLQGPAPVSGKHADEIHFSSVVQLTTGGENAEAYWSYDGTKLIYQSHEGEGCDQIYIRDAFDPAGQPKLVSTGKGATTCSYFMPGDKEIIYGSTHLGGDACPPKADQKQGYVWALYDTYDIFKANVDGSNVRQLTKTPGYDAEATVCPLDGSIIFTSVRDKDIELYRMDADGKNVKRLTNTLGYDGGAFFSTDCKKIVWRASRPEGEALTDFQRLLGIGLVRPTKLELYVANADGTDVKQVTDLNVAAFGPYFYPGSNRIIFSSNYGDPKGREFDLWAINVDGTGLERITHSEGFDGFPMFSPDGKFLVFASNRASKPGTWDTNLFVAQWLDAPVPTTQGSAQR
jgi:Tol biopolymer transport system component